MNNFLMSGMVTDNFRLVWKISEKCNYKCPYCIINARTGDAPKESTEDEIYNIYPNKINKIISSIQKTVSLEITGGEPTIWNLKLILKDILTNNNLVDFSMNTNAWRDLDWWSDFFNFLEAFNKNISIITSIHETEVDDLNALLKKIYAMQKMAPNINIIASFVKSNNKWAEDILDKFSEEHQDFKFFKVQDYRENING